MSGSSASWFLGMVMGGALGSAIALCANCAYAQITPDGTLPNNSIVTPDGSTLNITGGTQAGGNLFHSFQQFSVPTGGTALFNNAADIQNIISRVTGGSISNIDGIIKANGTANLFLINPSGIIFGRNASLNVGGSFVATTANAIGFGNQGFFSATAPNTPELLTVNPSVFFFNQIAVASIQNNSVAPAGLNPNGILTTEGLRVPDGKSLLLVGGNISMDGGRLNAFGGQVELGGLAGAGTVGLNVDGMLSLSFPNGVERGDVSLSNNSVVNVRASSGGSININARNLDITGSHLLAGIGQNLGMPNSQAGDITLNGTSAIRINQQSTIENTVDSNATGNSGNINITAQSLWVTDNETVLSTMTKGLGNAGNIIINTSQDVKFDVSPVRTSVEGGIGKGGDIRITTGTLSLTNESNLYASTQNAQGDAGNVILNARDRVWFDQKSYVSTSVVIGSTGNAGDIRISTPTLSLTNGSQLFADTDGNGNAGSVIINADRIYLDGRTSDDIASGIFSRVLREGIGKGGDIRISTGSLSVTNGAALFAFINGQGDGGNLIIDARDFVSFDGVGSNGIPSGVFTTVNKEGRGNGANVSITTGSLSLSNKAELITSTDGQGNAGNVIVDAHSISLDNDSRIITNAYPNSTRKGGDIFITTKDFSLANRALVSASTVSTQNVAGKSGDITVDTNTLGILNGAELDAVPASRPNAGNITINSKTLTIDGGKITVESKGTGVGGNIRIKVGNLTLKNQAQISAETASSQGGNIEINLKDILLLRQGSRISTNAGTARQPGDGGNITISAPSGFIVAGPRENSDITANAFNGSGGRVDITAQAIFGIQPRLRPTSLSDITASSEFGVNGTVELNTPDIDLNSGLVNLPSVPIDTELAQGCYSPGYAQSSFIITGRGGLPPNPKEVLSPDAVEVDWVTLDPDIDNRKIPSVSTLPTNPTPERIVEATGWVFNAKGQVEFIADAPTVTPNGSWQNPISCRASG